VLRITANKGALSLIGYRPIHVVFQQQQVMLADDLEQFVPALLIKRYRGGAMNRADYKY